MSTKIAYLGTKRITFETERDVKVVLIGQRKPKEEAEVEAPVEVKGHAMKMSYRYTSDFYAPKALNWWETPEQAKADEANFPDFINFRTIPVDTTVP